VTALDLPLLADPAGRRYLTGLLHQVILAIRARSGGEAKRRAGR
jgi:hypothetical protein